VQPGEVVGIIGRNGAGKSTLLKILSRITEPTAGRCEIRGRMASLLEVGTGFHQELTGRENVYLNGSILGMTRQEINQKFDDIVAFSEIEQFLDTPVKRFSSGMYVRLAFAVAAHLEPELLVIDEVLAVGDATFQKRCINRMAELARTGRTVLVVSHNMEMIARLCQHGIMLEKGRLIEVGRADAIVRKYLELQTEGSNNNDLDGCNRVGDGRARFKRFWLEDPNGRRVEVHNSGEDLTICMEVESSEPIRDVALAVTLQTISGTRLISSWTRESGFQTDLELGTQLFRCRFERVAIRPCHRVEILLWLEAGGGPLDFVQGAGIVDVIDGPNTRHYSTDAHQGIILYPSSWERMVKSEA
jgi:lipopolysaccharide transport system ATP-binding protein